jgi:hypothetical protein
MTEHSTSVFDKLQNLTNSEIRMKNIFFSHSRKESFLVEKKSEGDITHFGILTTVVLERQPQFNLKPAI